MNILAQCSHYTYVDKIVNKNEEFVKSKIKSLKPTWTNHMAKKIQISVDKDCLVKINGEDEVLIKPQYGLTVEYTDADIETVVSLTDGVSVYAIIGY